MNKYISKLTKRQEESMSIYAKKWIKIGLKTGKTDWKTFDKYMPICYKKAGLKYPSRVIRVNSPIVGALAASLAESILRKKGDAVGDAVSGAVRDAVRGAVGGAVRGAVGGAVSGAVSGAVRDAVSGAVGDAVGGAVGDAVGDAVGGAVGDAVGDAVSDAVRGAVETSINIAKKTNVSLSWHCWLGGQFWVGGWYWGVAFVNFFFDICKLELSKDIMEKALAYRKVCESVNYIWPNSDFVMVCARPIHILKDGMSRLHSITGKAIEYPDGWGLYMINGIRFEEELWKKISNGSITPQEIFKIENMEQRRVAYERMDKIKMKSLPNFKVLDEGTDEKKNTHKVISFTVEGFKEPFKYYNCICPSTGREYFVETLKDKCKEAKEASFGLSDVEFVEEY